MRHFAASVRQLVDALAKYLSGDNDLEANLRGAELYVRNADHDITDAVDFIKRRLDDALTNYGVTNVVTAFPRAIEIKEIAHDIHDKNKKIACGSESHDATYEAIYREDAVRMVTLYTEYEKARPRILDNAVKLERKYALSKWFNIIVGIGELIGVGITVFSWIVPYATFREWLLATIARLI